MNNPEFDVVIIGGGVIGLSVLHKCVERKIDAVLVERHDALGRETSSRNSEVIHGGMYYAPGSLKARLSVTGRRQLYEFAGRYNVPHLRIGKVIVATDAAEVAGLERILATGRANGVEGLRMITSEEVAALAPGATAVAGLYSPETGIVNAHHFMNALARVSCEGGGMTVCGATVNRLDKTPNGWDVSYRDAEGLSTVRCRAVVNAAGLGAQATMRMAGLDPEAVDLKLYPCKGNYFSVGGESRKRIRGLVYPAPEANLAGLGIHTIAGLGGEVKLGPNVQYVNEADEYDYSVDEGLRETFFTNARRYLPFLQMEDIQPDMAGIRSKLSGPGQAARDFYIEHESERGLSGFINLAGIESPGLTSSLAIGDVVAEITAAVI